MKVFRLGMIAILGTAAWAQSPQQPSSTDQPGPTILSRADMEVPPETMAQENRAHNYLNYFAFVNGFLNTGSGSFTNNGVVQKFDYSDGVDAGGGITAVHNFQHGLMSVAYSGGYRYYSNSLNNSNYYHNLAFAYNYRINRRWLLALRQSIQILPQGYVAPQITSGLAPLGLNGIASQQQFYVSSATVQYQQTMRLSYEFGGDFFYSRYTPVNLFSSRGFGANGAVNYRVTKKTSFGAGYNFSYFSFSGGVGHSQTNSVFGSLSHVFTPHLQGGVSAGVSRTNFEEPLAVQTAGGIVRTNFSRTTYSPYVNARIAQVGKRYTLTLNFTDGVNAGNGTYATSRSLNASGGISYALSRRFGVNGNAGYSRYQSIAGPTLNINGDYGYSYGSVATSFKLSRHIGTNVSASYSSSDALGNVASHNYFSLYAGIVFTSGDYPVFTY